MKLSPASITLSVLAHAALVVVLLVGVRPPALKEPPPTMQAVLITPAKPQPVLPPAAIPEPQPAPVVEPAPKLQPKSPPKIEPKPEPKPTPKPEPKSESKPTPKPEPKPTQPSTDELKAKLEAEAQKLAQAEKAKQEKAAALKRQAALAAAMEAEAELFAQTAAQNAIANQQAAQIAEFTQAIHKKIKSQWRRPPEAASQLSVKLRISLFPGGEIASIVILQSSGVLAFDESVKAAITSASPLPVPADNALFRNNFKVFILNFNTEE